MIEHAVPQNITSYQFRLVGDMTLKQFLELAGGILAGWLIWSLNIPVIFRLPLAILSAVFGAALAFLPLEERPLDQWLRAFLHAVYGPTLFTWKKRSVSTIVGFSPKGAEQQRALVAATKAPSAKLQTLLEAYQMQMTEIGETEDPLESVWQKRQQSLPDLFQQVIPSQQLINEVAYPQKLPIPVIRLQPQPAIHALTEPTDSQAILRGEIVLPPRIVKVPSSQPVSVPVSDTISESVDLDLSDQTHARGVTPIPSVVPSVLTGVAVPAPTSVASSSRFPLPPTPTTPNILSGVVVDGAGSVVDDAILEICDQAYLPVRAVKTNRLGQFSIATPLANGSYTIEIERDDLSFDILTVEAKGEIIQPIAIQARHE